MSIAIFCVRCDRSYIVDFNEDSRVSCPLCRCVTWSFRDAAAVDSLVSRWTPLVHRLVRRRTIWPRLAQIDLVESAAFEGLLRAARCWDEARGFKFVTVAWPTISHSISSELKRQQGKGRNRLRQLPEDDRGSDRWAMLLDDAPRVDAQIINDEEQWNVNVALGTLKDRYRLVLELRYFYGCMLGAIGQRIGVTYERVRQIETEALDRLRRALPK